MFRCVVIICNSVGHFKMQRKMPDFTLGVEGYALPHTSPLLAPCTLLSPTHDQTDSDLLEAGVVEVVDGDSEPEVRCRHFGRSSTGRRQLGDEPRLLLAMERDQFDRSKKLLLTALEVHVSVFLLPNHVMMNSKRAGHTRRVAYFQFTFRTT